MNVIVIRDSLRNEKAKQKRYEDEMEEQTMQQEKHINKLNLMINQAEQEMDRLQSRYKDAVQHRNDRYRLLVYCCKRFSKMTNGIKLFIPEESS